MECAGEQPRERQSINPLNVDSDPSGVYAEDDR